MIPDVRLIDANALRKDIHTSYSDDLGILEHIDNSPTIDAQPVKHGRWIPFMPDCRGYTEEFECSLCNNMTYLHYCEKDCDYEYCPNCGAKMDGGDADET